MARDRLILAGPVAGQAVAFGMVLAIGALAGHTSMPPQPTGHGVLFNVAVKSQSSGGVFAGSRVAVLDTATLRRITWGLIPREGPYRIRLSPGSYQVCLDVPAQFELATPGVSALQRPLARWRLSYPYVQMLPVGSSSSAPPGWACALAAMGRVPMTITFILATSSPRPTANPRPTTSASAGKSRHHMARHASSRHQATPAQSGQR